MDKFLEKYLETLYRKGNKFFMGDLVHDPFTLNLEKIYIIEHKSVRKYVSST